MPPTRMGHVAVVLLAGGLFAASPAIAGSDMVRISGPGARYGTTVPAHAHLELEAEYDAAGDTSVTLRATGLVPATAYAGRAALGGCPTRAGELGPTYQLLPTPAGADPRDPAFTNEVNEVWLELQTDSRGAATATAVQPWQFPPARRPGSVIIHEHVEPVRPGGTTAGRALACLEVAF